MFRVSLEDLNCAKLIVNDLASSCLLHNDAMCEPATHPVGGLSNILDRQVEWSEACRIGQWRAQRAFGRRLTDEHRNM